ncbi:hypothetical protein XENOCAPTIV_013612 [Xenoophorus captivus]|uniref:Uncharacterized protein n=1 Tax=Xenoophorus captivus TaxID=1517983 RepID=A0ABV0Q503_9TELE
MIAKKQLLPGKNIKNRLKVHLDLNIYAIICSEDFLEATMSPVLRKIIELESSLSDRLLHPRCTKEPYHRPLLPADARLYNHHYSQKTQLVYIPAVICIVFPYTYKRAVVFMYKCTSTVCIFLNCLI